MKVLSQLLGRYSTHNKPLILFRLPDTDTLFYRQSDIEPLFNLPAITFDNINLENCYRDQEDTYLNTKALADIAFKHSRYSLAELCKLKSVDYNNGLADAILHTFPEFKRAPPEEHIWESVQLPLENLSDILARENNSIVKSEPMSPPALHQMSDIRNAMALDKVLLNTNELRRQNHNSLEYPNKRYKVETTASSAPTMSNHGTSKDKEKRPSSLSTVIPVITTHSPNDTDDESYSSSLSHKKRLSIKHKNALNLTIFAPSYSNQYEGIRSAPINSNFNKPIPHPAPSNKSNFASNNLSAAQKGSLAPVSATIARPPFAPQPSPRRLEFAIPPIVPSQQQPPLSAQLPLRENVSFKPYPPPSSTSSHYSHHPHSKGSYSSSRQEPQQLAVNAANVQLPPKTPTTSSFAALQRQQYLQPFEHLFDTIETTRTLKTTLDDQIRRSSTLMQTLQTSATTMEGLIRNQIKEAQWEMVSQLEQTVQNLTKRIEVLETKLDINSHSVDTPTTETDSVNDTHRKTTLKSDSRDHSLPSPLPSATREERSESLNYKRTHSEELQIPPTIVRSQNDIGPQEYHNMLNTLKDRLDRLERQIET
ncbi:hypothetical protein BDB01DRAFT_319239 [Pilobolus umbonatus]|nr:hypothetical protein BDB01DRAFT_319239 [Pilobolus umbonatus]